MGKSEVYYICHTCNERRIDGNQNMVAHLKAVHGVDLDGADYFKSVYEWNGNGVEFTSSDWRELNEDDMMRF